MLRKSGIENYSRVQHCIQTTPPERTNQGLNLSEISVANNGDLIASAALHSDRVFKSQDLETGCTKLANGIFLEVHGLNRSEISVFISQ